MAAILDTKRIYIADGHHRLDVSYRLGVPYAPFYLTDMYDEGIVILPYHRLVRFNHKRPLAELIAALESCMTIERRPFTGDDALEGSPVAVAASPRPALLFSADDRQHLYTAVERSPLPMYNSPDLHDSLKRLKVNVIHSGVIRGILGIRDDEISFTEDHGWSVDSVRNASSDLAFFLPPTTVDEVRDMLRTM